MTNNNNSKSTGFNGGLDNFDREHLSKQFFELSGNI